MARFGAPTRRYHVHWPGIFAIGLTVLLMLGAINSQNNLLFIVFGLVMSSIVVSGILSGTMLMGISASRVPSPMIAVGESGAIEYTITNKGRILPAFALLVREIEPPSDSTRVRPGTRARTLPAFARCIHPGHSARIRAETLGLARGAVPLVGIEISTSFPFGIFRKSIRFADRTELLIAPTTRSIPASDLDAITGRLRAGSSPRPRAGRGLDFFGLRDYVPGDSPKRLAWKAWARTDQIVVHQAADEPSRSVRIVLALDHADGDPACERAISEAASIALGFAGAGTSAELIIAGRGITVPIDGPRTRNRVLSTLARLNLAESSAPLGAGAPRGPDLIVVPSGPIARSKAPHGRIWSIPR